MAILRARLGNGKAGAPDIGILEGSLYYDFINKMSAKVHINFPHAELKELGFPDSYNFDGVGLITEFGVPASTGYLLNLDQMELLMMYDQLFTSKGPEWDIKTFSYLWALCTYGNFKYISPKYQTKLYPYAAS